MVLTFTTGTPSGIRNGSHVYHRYSKRDEEWFSHLSQYFRWALGWYSYLLLFQVGFKVILVFITVIQVDERVVLTFTTVIEGE
ncbi:hypothetical protein RRG08_057017 [Elysia crispata]|uniref:Uncharacterized protein n=1 Tax=Elysia crispata TaxID=231223 RepID=A0AAE0Z653_9GAST|nr:hypothetical protein RRG08_057017 [Elysia crispata]